jgi:hypothetical protein
MAYHRDQRCNYPFNIIEIITLDYTWMSVGIYSEGENRFLLKTWGVDPLIVGFQCPERGVSTHPASGSSRIQTHVRIVLLRGLGTCASMFRIMGRLCIQNVDLDVSGYLRVSRGLDLSTSSLRIFFEWALIYHAVWPSW